ncbi:alpha/beta fold hydrolase [Nocardia sp. NPDC057030]|uniref:alpha/beta fold hydrolase n=1 Tax=unclassified Nocardia TaxID=2637762 RepID=UPI0036382758
MANADGKENAAYFRGGTGQPLLLLHGGTGTWHHWRPVLPKLTTAFEVIAPTLAGHVGGPRFPVNVRCTISTAADALERQLDDLGVDKAHAAGNSYGGALGIELAKRGRVHSVVALSPAFGWEPGSTEGARTGHKFAVLVPRARRSYRAAPFVLRSAAARRFAFREAMLHGDRMSVREALEFTRGAAEFTMLDVLLPAIRTDADCLPADLDQITTPVLLAWAEHDRFVPAATCATRYRREIPGAEFRLLPAVGHVPMWDNPDLVADTIIEWAHRHEPVRE